MRIAIFHNLPSGGGKRALFEMTRRLAERHEIDVFTLSTAEHEFCDLRPYCRRHIVAPFQPMRLARRPFGRLNQGIRSLDLLRINDLQKSIASRIDSENYDLVFAHGCRFGQSPSVLRYLETPAAYYCQEPPRLLYEPNEERFYRRHSKIQKLGNSFDPLPGVYRRTLRRLDRQNVRSATSVLVNSQYSRETLYRVYGILGYFSRLGVDTTRFRPIGLEKNPVALSVGALTSKKGFDFAIQGIARIEPQVRPSLTIVSNFVEVQEETYLRSLAEQLAVELTICVDVPDDDLVRLYNRSMFVVYTPIMEPFGFVPLEAMACGVPVVGIREAGVRETIQHGITGFLVERDAQQLAVAMLALFENPGLRERFGHQARTYVEREWTWEHSIRDLEPLLQRTANA